jgi:hypothetical protein
MEFPLCERLGAARSIGNKTIEDVFVFPPDTQEALHM